HPSHSFCGFVGASLLAKLWRGLIREQARSYRCRVENREAFSTVLLHWWKAFGVFHPTLQLYLSALLISRDNRPHKRRPHEGRPSGSCEEPPMRSEEHTSELQSRE